MGIVNDIMTAPAWEEELGKSSVYKAIQDEAISAGINPKEFMQLAQIESNFKPMVESDQGYRGLFQLDPSNYRGAPPFNIPSLFDSKVNAALAAKEYKKYKGSFLNKVIAHNQGKKGSRQILNAHSAGESIKAHSTEPWNRTKKVLNNLSDTSLGILATKYNLKVNRSQLIASMVVTIKNQRHIVEDDPMVVDLYITEQEGKVKSSGSIVDKILKEI